jgi:hypothetical protein
LFGLDNDDAGTDSLTTLVNITPTGTGIGTASPCSTCTLHVAGGASVTGAFDVGNGTFTVATTGIVSAPSQPFVRALDFGQDFTSAGTRLYFSAPAANENNASMYGGAASSGTFTVPAGGAGTYLIKCQTMTTGVGAWGLMIKVDGTGVGQTFYNNTVNKEWDMVSVTKYLTAGQYAECFGQAAPGSRTTPANFGSFEMVKLW